MMMSSFSVVVPVHDEADLLRRCLPSVFGLGASEYVFVLDRCGDDSGSVINVMAAKFGLCDKVFVVRLSERNGADFCCRLAYVRWVGRRLACSDVVVEVDADLIVDSSCLGLIESFGGSGLSCLSFLHKDYPVGFRNLLKRLYVRVGLPFSWLGAIMVYRRCDALAVEDLVVLKGIELAEDTLLHDGLRGLGPTKCVVSGVIHLRPKADSVLQGRLSWTVGCRGWMVCLLRGFALFDFGFLRGYINARFCRS